MEAKPGDIGYCSDNTNNQPEYIPSRAMIWAECQRIQATWTEEERRLRRGERPPDRVEFEPVTPGRFE